MSGEVEILEVREISLPPLPNPSPPAVKLTFFDTMWVGFPPIQRLLLYSNTTDHPIILPFSTLVDFLKSSLSSTLVDFLPLAGKLTYVPSSGDVEIDCSEPAYGFVTAESDIDPHRLIADEIHDIESFRKLVPAIDVSKLPFRLFSVQITRFKCGAVAVGYAAHHTVGDGKALWQFMEAWTSTCRAEMNGKPRPQYPVPSYDRTIIRHPKKEQLARMFLQSWAPNLPYTNSETLEVIVNGVKKIRRTFVLSASNIQTLKQRATRHDSNMKPSTFLAISAHVWSCFVRAKSFEPGENSIVCVLTDCRPRLDPPVEDGYFGNCVRLTNVNILVGDQTSEDRLSRACEEISTWIRRMSEDPLSDVEDWYHDFQNLPLERVTNVTASPRFKIYETDFGFGRPDRVELVSMNHDGEVTLAGGKEEGTVQVTVSLNRDQMETYAKAFEADLYC